MKLIPPKMEAYMLRLISLRYRKRQNPVNAIFKRKKRLKVNVLALNFSKRAKG
jgi:hypothetical protein